MIGLHSILTYFIISEQNRNFPPVKSGRYPVELGTHTLIVIELSHLLEKPFLMVKSNILREQNLENIGGEHVFSKAVISSMWKEINHEHSGLALSPLLTLPQERCRNISDW